MVSFCGALFCSLACAYLYSTISSSSYKISPTQQARQNLDQLAACDWQNRPHAADLTRDLGSGGQALPGHCGLIDCGSAHSLQLILFALPLDHFLPLSYTPRS